MAKKKTTEVIPLEDRLFTAVVYGDGSANYADGSYGAGITGYIFDNTSKGKKSGDVPSRYTITDIGYIENELLLKHKYNTVIPDFYIDGIFGYTNKGTSNRAELLAFIESMNKLLIESNLNITNVVFKSDSAYALLCIENIYTNDNWKSSLKENLDLLDMIDNVCKLLKEKNIKLDIIKVKGHATSLGNNLADRLANLARNTKKQEFKMVEANKRWIKPDLLPTMLKFKQLFFINNNQMINENVYSIMDYKTGVEPGKKTHEATFGVVITKDPVKLVHDVTNIYNDYYKSLALLSAIDLNNLYSVNSTYYNSIFGLDIYSVNPKNNVLIGLENEPIIKAIYPPGLAIQAYERMKGMYEVLNKAINNKKDKDEEFIDITRELYDVDSKPKQFVCTIDNGVNDIDIKVNAFNHEFNVAISLGKDALSRNQFKALEKEKPIVLLHLYKIDNTVEYQTIVLTDSCNAVYSNIYSCKVFL